MKAEVLIEVLTKILKSYKKELEQSPNINIIESFYFDESTETLRRQIIVDYQIQQYQQSNQSQKSQQHLYHI